MDGNPFNGRSDDENAQSRTQEMRDYFDARKAAQELDSFLKSSPYKDLPSGSKELYPPSKSLHLKSSQKSMSLEYEPSLELLHIYVK